MSAQNISIPKLGVVTFSLILFSMALLGCGEASNRSVPMTNTQNKICTDSFEAAGIFDEVEPEMGEDVSERDLGSRTLRRRTVRVDFNSFRRAIRSKGPQTKPRLSLDLFEDRRVDIVVDEVRESSNESTIVTGTVLGTEKGYATLVVNKGVMVGNIFDENRGERIEIRYLSDGTHSIRSVGEDFIHDCAAVEADDFGHEPAVGAEDRVEGLDADPVVDILAVYTPAARAHQGGKSAIEALIQMGIADTNRALSDSGAAMSVRLVGMMELSQNESTNFSSDLSALRSTTDGKWDEVHAERRRLGADQVSLVGAYTGNTSVAGIGYISSSAASAFTITRTSAFGQYTFTHEFGHNVGLRHEDGYQNASGRFRTIMAYGSYPRIRRFSNPSRPYNGYATGNSSQNSVATVLANTSRMANLVASIVPLPTPVPIPEPTPVPTPTPSPSATPSEPGGTPKPLPTAAPVPVCFD